MTNLKTKLADSVRQAKANTANPTKRQAPAAPPPVVKKAAPTTQPKPAESRHAAPAAGTSASDPQASGNALFPSRVWPD